MNIQDGVARSIPVSEISDREVTILSVTSDSWTVTVKTTCNNEFSFKHKSLYNIGNGIIDAKDEHQIFMANLSKTGTHQCDIVSFEAV